MIFLQEFFVITLFISITVVKCGLNSTLGYEPVEEKASAAPYNDDTIRVKVLLVTPTQISISVSWDKLEYNSEKWSIEIMKEDRRVFNARPNLETRNKYTVMGLDPGTSYQIIVRIFTPDHKEWKASNVTIKTRQLLSPDGLNPVNSETTHPPIKNELASSVTIKTLLLLSRDGLNPVNSETTHPPIKNELASSVTIKTLLLLSRDGLNPVNSETTHPTIKNELSETIFRVLKVAAIVASSGIAGLSIISVLFFIVIKVQRKTDKFSVRRKKRSESFQPNEENTTKKTQKGKDRKDSKDEGGKNIDKRQEKTQEVATKSDMTASHSSLLQLPQQEPLRIDRNTNACSMISWGSEFEAPLEQGDNIYTNETFPPIASHQPTYPNATTLPHLISHNRNAISPPDEMIYSNDSKTASKSLSRNLSLQHARSSPMVHVDTPYSPPPYCSAVRKNSTPPRTWNTCQGIDIVIPPTPCKNQSQAQEVYANVDDQNALYVNSGDLKMDCSPPTIPRR